MHKLYFHHAKNYNAGKKCIDYKSFNGKKNTRHLTQNLKEFIPLEETIYSTKKNCIQPAFLFTQAFSIATPLNQESPLTT